MAEAPAVQMPFCRELASNDSPPDVVVGRLVARVAELEQQIYQRELQESNADGDSDGFMARIANFIQRSSTDLVSHLHLGTEHQQAGEVPQSAARIAAQSIIEATERMQAAEHEAIRLANLLTSSMEASAALQDELDAVSAAGAEQDAHQAELTALRDEVDMLQGRLCQLKGAADAAEAARDKLQQTAAASAEREALLQERLVELTSDVSRAAEVAASLRRQVRELLGAAQDAALTHGALQAEKHGLERRIEELEEQHAASQAQLDTARSASDDFERKFLAEREQRRQVHEQLQLLRGNIRVLCRVRPASGSEEPPPVVHCPPSYPGEVVVQPLDKRPQSFEFPCAFGAESTQAEVFEEVKPLVRSCLDGYNACIFAYGQTGSGKTFTMDGPEELPGINSRAVQMLFEVAAAETPEHRLTMSVACLEIYCDSIRDLLAGAKDLTLEVSGLGAGQLPPGAERIPGLTWRSVESVQDINTILKESRRSRTTASTAMNARSSRSHSMLSVRLQPLGGSPPSLLHLVDLAGSERVGKSEAAGQQLKEAQAINRSLSALGDVISALQQGNSHIPYRNSKLTQVLQDALCNSSKTLLVCNLSHEAASVSETLSSLHFAHRAAQVELGPIRRAGDSTPSRRAGESTPSRKAGDCTPSRKAASDSPPNRKTTDSPPGGASTPTPAAGRRTPLTVRIENDKNAATPPTVGQFKARKPRPILQERRQ